MSSEKSIVDDIHRPDEIRAKEIENTNKQYEKLKIKSDIDDLKIKIIIKKCELSRLEYDYKNKNSLNKYKSRSPQM
ncbi:hypothetical protein [Spiroplasma endosymbiont of Virgichneumon dumeticola]|uniref:hypothetical protein n=1 Tax=Spiroplasma endosymbiont of Virgichneumon dumeticola TaxID=3139323 RepID=UPI0035C93032